MIGNDATVPDFSRGQKRPPSGRWVKWAAGLAFATLCGALTLANYRNVDLKTKKAQIEEVAAKRALEIKRLTEQQAAVAIPSPVVPAKPSSAAQAYPSGAPDSGTEDDPNADDDAVTDLPIDGSVPPKPAEKW